MDVRKLEVGDVVEVGRLSYHGMMLFAAQAKVTKKNKVRVVLETESGHIFNFSARIGELILGGGKLHNDVFVRPVGFFQDDAKGYGRWKLLS